MMFSSSFDYIAKTRQVMYCKDTRLEQIEDKLPQDFY